MFDAGALPWTYATVKALLPTYPRRGQLDVVKFGQEDEATDDPDGVLWDDEENKTTAEEDQEEEEEAAQKSDDDKEIDAVADFDPNDWVDPETALVKYAHRGDGDDDGDVPHRGDGDKMMRRESE